MFSSQIAKLAFLRPRLQGSVSALATRLKSTTLDSQSPPVKTRPKRPLAPFLRFKNERMGLREMSKEISKKWKEMTEEEKRPFVEEREAMKVRWEAENISTVAQLKALKEGDKIFDSNAGFILFSTEAQVPYDPNYHRTIKVAEMWKHLTEEERNAYKERANDLKEKGQEQFVEAAMKKVAKGFAYLSPYHLFRCKSVPEVMKARSKELRIEWEGLSKEEKSPYTDGYEEERQQYLTKLEEYKEGAEFKERKKAVSVIKAKIKKLEEEMNKPKLRLPNTFILYREQMREMSEGADFIKVNKSAATSWKAMSDEEKAVYKRRWEELKSKWQEDMAEWELKNADSPKMSEWKAVVRILKSQKEYRSIVKSS